MTNQETDDKKQLLEDQTAGHLMQPKTDRTRMTAILVLIAALPALLLSLAALALFYISPARFNWLLAHLPGETVIRTLLFFAPVALFAVVLLAMLYSGRDRSAQPEEPAADLQAGEEKAPIPAQVMARMVLIPSLPLMLLAMSALVMGFVSPERFEEINAAMPGGPYSRILLFFAPIGLLIVIVPSLLLALGWIPLGNHAAIGETGKTSVIKRLSRAGVLSIFIPSALLLLLSITIFILSYLKPAYFERLMAHLQAEGVIRLGMLFTTAALMAIVLLSALYLSFRPSYERADLDLNQQTQPALSKPDDSGKRLMLWPLAAGLFLTAVMGLALFGVGFYLLLH